MNQKRNGKETGLPDTIEHADVVESVASTISILTKNTIIVTMAVIIVKMTIIEIEEAINQTTKM